MNGDDLIDAVSMVDDDLIEEAAEYKKEGKGHIVLIVSAFAASAAAIAVVNNLPGYTSDPHDFEVDNSVQTVVTTEASTAGTSGTDAVSYVSAGTGTAPFTEPETSKSSDTFDSVTDEVTEAAQTESPSKTAAPPSPSPSAENVRTEAKPVTEQPVITESPATEKIVTEATHPEESQTLPPRPVPSPDPPVTVPERPTPLPTPMPVTTVTMPQRPTLSPDPVLPVNRENNTFDHATLSGKAYSKKCVYTFDESILNEKTLNAFFESVVENTGVMAPVKTASEVSSEEMFLLKCGSADGQYYVFLNDELSEERENQILKIFEITEFTTFFDETTNNLYRGDDT